MRRMQRQITLIIFLVLLVFAPGGCTRENSSQPEQESPDVPRGYVPTLEVRQAGHILQFGPFVGYYFLPPDPEDLSRVKFVCFNERQFYASDVPANLKLFEGEALLRELADAGFDLPAENRINPVFFENAPEPWVQNRPEPQEEFLHFHSCYDAAGPVRKGYWLRHTAVRVFTYDMGGKVGPDSPLYHPVKPGPDTQFARIIEFDRGPDTGQN